MGRLPLSQRCVFLLAVSSVFRHSAAAPFSAFAAGSLLDLAAELFGRQAACSGPNGSGVTCSAYVGVTASNLGACCGASAHGTYCCDSNADGCCSLAEVQSASSASASGSSSGTSDASSVGLAPQESATTSATRPSSSSSDSSSTTSSTSSSSSSSSTSSEPQSTSSSASTPTAAPASTPTSVQSTTTTSTLPTTHTSSPRPTTTSSSNQSSSTPSPTPTLTPTPTRTSSSFNEASQLATSSSFYTSSKFIGGLAGGGAVALLVLIFLLFCCCYQGSVGEFWNATCCCCRVKLKRTRSSYKRHKQRNSLPASASTAQEWQALYEREATRIKGLVADGPGANAHRAQLLETFSASTLAQRWRDTAIDPAAATCEGVAQILTAALGMGPAPDVRSLYREACSARARPWLELYLRQSVRRAYRYLRDEAVQEAWLARDLQAAMRDEVDIRFRAYQVQAGCELSFLRPAAGVLYAVARGLVERDDGPAAVSEALADRNRSMGYTLDFMFGAAIDYHRKVLIVNALARTFPPEMTHSNRGIFTEHLDDNG